MNTVTKNLARRMIPELILRNSPILVMKALCFMSFIILMSLAILSNLYSLGKRIIFIRFYFLKDELERTFVIKLNGRLDIMSMKNQVLRYLLKIETRE
jgi:hypothetical protein